MVGMGGETAPAYTADGYMAHNMDLPPAILAAREAAVKRRQEIEAEYERADAWGPGFIRTRADGTWANGEGEGAFSFFSA